MNFITNPLVTNGPLLVLQLGNWAELDRTYQSNI